MLAAWTEVAVLNPSVSSAVSVRALSAGSRLVKARELVMSMSGTPPRAIYFFLDFYQS